MINGLYMTRGVAELISANNKFSKAVVDSIDRFTNRDWGDLCNEDKIMNDNADKNKDRIVARYNIEPRAIYIITEWDKSATTILFPEEY